jgi:hypothetical protein
MNTYIWEIESLDCKPDGEAKVVSCIHWRLKGDDGANTAEIYGAQAIQNDVEKPFIAYEALTKDDVIGWVQNAMGNDAIVQLQINLDKQLENLANPPVVTPPLPWAE